MAFVAFVRLIAGLSLGELAEPVVVKRPDPGLARGVWEAPPWVFAAVAVAVVTAALVVFVRRSRGSKP